MLLSKANTYIRANFPCIYRFGDLVDVLMLLSKANTYIRANFPCIYRFGDLVDVLALVSTVFGICTNMGIGAVQLNTGLHRLNNGIERSILVQVRVSCIYIMCVYVCVYLYMYIYSSTGICIRRTRTGIFIIHTYIFSCVVAAIGYFSNTVDKWRP